MSRLIKNELIKIFKKKSIYIALVIILGYIILTNCIYKFYTPTISNYSMSEEYVNSLKREIETLDPENPADTSIYISLKTTLDIYEIEKKYEENSWQTYIVQTELGTIVSEKNTLEYSNEKNEQAMRDLQERYDSIIEKLDKGDWKYFAQEDLNEVNKKIENLQKQKENTIDKQQIEQIEISIKEAEIEKQILDYRLEKDIEYGNNYLNQALDTYSTSSQNVLRFEDKEDLNYEDKKIYNQSIKDKEEAKYIIENKQNINKTDDLRGILIRIFNEYGLFILVIIIMISGTIVSEEFNKGTVKLLLVRPYSRTKILLSKFITSFIIILFTLVAVTIMQLIVGGILFGFDSLSIPVIQYDFNIQEIVSLNIFAYLGTQIIALLPFYILISTIAFACSTIFTNSALAMTIAFLGYMSSSIINSLVASYKIDFMRFFITMNWDFTQYLFGELPLLEGMNVTFSAVVCLAYFATMMALSIVIFKKKNIKNI